jgi:energy-coupling factor transporter ATP-binding protein EcfA2
MKLVRLDISDLRPMEAFTIDLRWPDRTPRNRVILLGANGSGKSTLLEAVATVLARALERPELNAPRFGAGDVRDGARIARVRLDIELDPEEERRVLALSPAPSSSQVSLDFRIGSESAVAAVGAENGYFVPSGTPWDRDELRRAMLPSAVSPSSTNGTPGLYLPASRGAFDNRPLTISRDEFAVSPWSDALARYPRGVDVLPERLALALSAPEAFDPSGRFRRLWKVLAKYLPQPDFPEPVRAEGFKLYFRTRTAPAVPFDGLSQGERAVLRIAADVAWRDPAGVVLIDEPEQHLHPRWQKALLDLLPALAPRAQFLFATHAPYFAACTPESVVKIGDEAIDG